MSENVNLASAEFATLPGSHPRLREILHGTSALIEGL